MSTNYVNPGLKQQYDVGVATTGVSSSSGYTLEIQYFFENGNAGETDVVVVDGTNQELDRFSLDEGQTRSNTGLAEDSFTLNQAATNYVSNTGNLYLRYEKTDSNRNKYIILEIGYQRLRTA
jgi:hypothetical protein